MAAERDELRQMMEPTMATEEKPQPLFTAVALHQLIEQAVRSSET